MRFLTVKSCCGFDLMTGGLLIGYYDLFLNGLMLLHKFQDPFTLAFLVNLFYLGIVIAWFHGIYYKKLNFMLFSVVFSIIGCAMLFGSLILLLLFGEMFTADIPKQILISELPKNSSLATTIQTHHQSMIIMLEGVVMLMWLTSTILFVIEWYFTAVKYSLYQSMKKGDTLGDMQEFTNVEI